MSVPLSILWYVCSLLKADWALWAGAMGAAELEAAAPPPEAEAFRLLKAGVPHVCIYVDVYLRTYIYTHICMCACTIAYKYLYTHACNVDIYTHTIYIYIYIC